MRSYNLDFKLPRLHQAVVLLVVSVLCLVPFSEPTTAQSGGTIETGTSIAVRTNEEINANTSDGRIYSGEVDQDVLDTRGEVALPRGTYVELVVRNISAKEYALDLESVTVNGQRMGVEALNTAVSSRREGIGANSRTGKYVGGGAVVGAIIGGIAGGGKGAAIGGGVGAAAGAGTQVLTRGKNVNVPPESLVTFRLEQPLRTGVADNGFSRNGRHYHNGYGTTQGNSAAYEAGLRAGRIDRDRSGTFNWQTSNWKGADLRDYQAGYERGFDESPNRVRQGSGSIRIGPDHYISWNGPADSRIYVEADGNPRQLFASGASGNQPAPWIRNGHRYIFILEDARGREIARDENDLRQIRRYR